MPVPRLDVEEGMNQDDVVGPLCQLVGKFPKRRLRLEMDRPAEILGELGGHGTVDPIDREHRKVGKHAQPIGGERRNRTGGAAGLRMPGRRHGHHGNDNK